MGLSPDAGGSGQGDPPIRLVTIGAASSANKGASSMLQALADNIGSFLGPCRIDVLTTYPGEDAAEPLQAPPGIEIRTIPFRPGQLLFPDLPLALVSAAARGSGGTGRAFCLTPALRSLFEADLILDLAGISFSDRRGTPTLVYNVLMTGIPLLVGGTVVKCSQALGPFEERLNRLAAGWVLPRLTAVTARGESTARHLRTLGLRNTERGADLAFLMHVPPETRAEAHRVLREIMGAPVAPFVAVVPSSVLQARCGRRGVDYVDVMVTFLRGLADDGLRLLLLPHAARPSRGPGRMNDLPLIRQIQREVSRSSCRVLDRSLSPQLLRALIGRADLLVTARFHGLISALCEGTPSLVTGWGHKYGEVLKDFDLEEWLIDPDDLAPDPLRDRLGELRERAPMIRSRIRARVPVVQAEARRNFEIIREALGREAPSP